MHMANDKVVKIISLSKKIFPNFSGFVKIFKIFLNKCLKYL